MKDARCTICGQPMGMWLNITVCLVDTYQPEGGDDKGTYWKVCAPLCTKTAMRLILEHSGIPSARVFPKEPAVQPAKRRLLEP